MHVTGPDQSVWWVTADVVGQVLADLRLKSDDVDAAKIARLVGVAGEMINDHLDRVHPIGSPTPAMGNALVALVRELYGRRDIPVMGAGGGTRVERADVDVDQGRIADILAALGPKKSRFGVG